MCIRDRAQTWARQRRIIGVPAGRNKVYPAFQFDKVGLPLPEMRDIICALAFYMSDEEIYAWLLAPCTELNGCAPREVLQRDPAAALDAALALCDGQASAHARGSSTPPYQSRRLS